MLISPCLFPFHFLFAIYTLPQPIFIHFVLGSASVILHCVTHVTRSKDPEHDDMFNIGQLVHIEICG